MGHIEYAAGGRSVTVRSKRSPRGADSETEATMITAREPASVFDQRATLLLAVPAVAVARHVVDVQSGKMRVLTQSSPARLDGYLKQVPTWKELGVDVEYATAQGFAGPRGMPPAAVAFWEGVLGKLAKDPEWQKTLDRSVWQGAYMTSAEMRRYYESEFSRLGAVLGELGLVKQ